MESPAWAAIPRAGTKLRYSRQPPYQWRLRELVEVGAAPAATTSSVAFAGLSPQELQVRAADDGDQLAAAEGRNEPLVGGERREVHQVRPLAYGPTAGNGKKIKGGDGGGVQMFLPSSRG